MGNLFGKRLNSARRMAGMSLQDLAEALDHAVSRQALHKYELGKMKPDSAMLIRFAAALRISLDYFFQPAEREVVLADVSYRKFKSKVSKTQQVAIEERVKEAMERYLELEEVVPEPAPTSYFAFDRSMTSVADVEEAARALRQQWDLGYDPIPDVIEMLEDKGYRVVEIDAPEGFDGLKAEVAGVKVIALRRADEPATDVVRRRLTALHELAHHSLKFNASLSEKEEERLCHAFAAAVLYPEAMARRELLQDRTLFFQPELVMIKERWGISFPAVFYRAKNLGLISEFSLSKLMISYKQRKLHLQEPGRYLSKERPMRFERLVFAGLALELLSPGEAAQLMQMDPQVLRNQLIPMA
jgi:Zn-dependent peptidase ImmA (M78 family)/DNA-binding XRE family transcriptional regulator